MSDTDFALNKIPLFADLNKDELERIAALLQEESHPKDAKIFAEGDEGNRLYIIKSGNVRISKFVAGIGEEALAILKPGDFFGEMSLLDDAPRSADAIAHEDCDLLFIDAQAFESLLFLDKDLAYNVLWTFVRSLSIRLRETNNKIRSFFAMTGGFS